MTTFELRDWPRQLFEPGGGEPFVLYYIYGNFPELPTLRVDIYRSSGVPRGLDLQMYNRDQHPEVLSSFLSGHFADFLATKPDIEGAVKAARHCIVLKGNPAESGDLNYLRDCVGVLSYLLDYGAIAILDPQTFTWWRASEWRTQIFQPDSIQPLSHVVILGSPEEADPSKLWLHTRGLRKFGRPDLSVHNVNESVRVSVIDMLNKYITYLALGGIIADGEEFYLDGIVDAVVCSLRGSDDDPDFNNRHVDIELARVAVI